MAVHFRYLRDKQFNSTEVTKIIITKFDSNSQEIDQILEAMKTQQQLLQNERVNLVQHPLIESELEKQPSAEKFAYFVPNNRLNHLLINHGTLLQQIDYLFLMGVTPAIERRKEWTAALNFYKFSIKLANQGITNPSLTNPQNNIKRLHAVHLEFLSDEEVSSGLALPYQKNTEDNQVIYVCNPETLELALRYCEPNSKLTIDGHWEHNKKAVHGVWDVSNASEIGASLSALLDKNPGKINAINLLGCEAGSLAEAEELERNLVRKSISFKDEQVSSFNSKEMAQFRNRTQYVSENGEFPYAKDSLAGQIILHLNDPNISVTASPSNTYPFPPTDKPSFNISSDSKEWKGEHKWLQRKEEESTWIQKLHRSKITYVNKAAWLLWANNLSSKDSADLDYSTESAPSCS